MADGGTAGAAHMPGMDIFDHNTYPDYLARDLNDLVVVATTETGPEELAVLLEIGEHDALGESCQPVGLGFNFPDDAHWPPRRWSAL